MIKEPFARFVASEDTGKDGKLIYGRNWNPRKKSRWLVTLYAIFADGHKDEREIRVREPVRFRELHQQVIIPEVNDLLPIGADVIESGFRVWDL